MASRDNPDFLSADTIKGDKVVNAAGDDLGKIEDLMFDLDNGRVGYAVLSFGGILGMGDKLFAIPWQALSLRLHEHAFTLDIPRDVLEKAEGFDKDNWPVTREELSRTYNYYGYQPYWQTGVTGRAGTSTESQGMVESQGPAGPGRRENPDFLSADSIKSDKVVNRDGDNIGKIEELMVDLQNGKIAYAVLSHGGFLGIGNKLFVIPWQSFTLRVHEHVFVLNIPKETLNKAKGIDKDNWPLTREELAKTFTYYGYQPYWTTEAVTGATVAAATGTAAGMVSETESERKARVERERQTAVSREAEVEGIAHVERERQTAVSREAVSEKVTRTETEIREPVETEAERKAKQERERLEALRKTEEEKVSQLERERMEKERLIEDERKRLAQLERDRAEAEKRAEAEREKLARLERELQEAIRREKTEEVVRLEKEMREVKMQEETYRSRIIQFERERVEAEKQVQTERERLAQLERERTEKARQAETEKEKMAQLERDQVEAERQVEVERQRLTQLERERTEKTRQAETEKERMARLERERVEAEKQAQTEREKLAQLEREQMEKGREAETERERLIRLEKERTVTERQVEADRERLAQMERERIEVERRIATKPRRESPDFLPSCTITGYKVINTNGDNIGRIEDLMIDLNNGRVAYAALSLGGFIGISDKLFAVPWQALSYIPDEQAFILAVPRNILEKAEGFDKDKCPTTRDELLRAYTYYGYQPYWQRGMIREEIVRQGRLETAEQLTAAEDKEEIEEREMKETDPEKLAELERRRVIAERREHKYD